MSWASRLFIAPMQATCSRLLVVDRSRSHERRSATLALP